MVRRRAAVGGRRREELRTILLLEPDAEVRQVLIEFLNRAGYIVVPAYTGDGAALLCDKLRIDMVLLDLVAPDVEGLALLARLQKLSPDSAIVVLTAVADEATDRQCRLAGADEVVQRPIQDLGTFAEILARVAKVREVPDRRRRAAQPGGAPGIA